MEKRKSRCITSKSMFGYLLKTRGEALVCHCSYLLQAILPFPATNLLKTLPRRKSEQTCSFSALKLGSPVSSPPVTNSVSLPYWHLSSLKPIHRMITRSSSHAARLMQTPSRTEASGTGIGDLDYMHMHGRRSRDSGLCNDRVRAPELAGGWARGWKYR